LLVEIVAELGSTHNGDIEYAKALADRAKRAGADTVKLQIFKARDIFSKDRMYYPELERAEVTFEFLEEFYSYTRKIGLDFYASVFHSKAIDWLSGMGVKRAKIATRFNRRYDYIRKILDKGMGLIVSFAPNHAYYMPQRMVRLRRNHKNVRYLFCIPKYPPQISELRIPDFLLTLLDGYSNHFPDIAPCLEAASKGAEIIETHVCDTRDKPGPDRRFALTFSELEELIKILTSSLS